MFLHIYIYICTKSWSNSDDFSGAAGGSPILLGNLEPSSRLTCVAFSSKNSGTVPSKPCLKGESPANVLEKLVTTNVKHRQKK